MSARSGDPDSRENSPDHEGSPGGKRASKKRKVLSCYACRNRKMKCDRVYPICGRCQKTGRADQCTYDPRLLEDAIVHSNGFHADPSVFPLQENTGSEHVSETTLLDALRSKAHAQERRIGLLERKLAAKENYPPSHFEDFNPTELQIKEDMIFRGKGFKTQFCGSTSVMSTIAQFRELQAFTREALMLDHSMMRVKTDFKAFRDSRKTYLKQMSSHRHGTNEEVFAVLPDRITVDMQVGIYFQTWENTYRILHEPSFWKEYSIFWEQQPGESGSSGFAVVLVLIIAITKCLKPKDDLFEGDTSSDRRAASNLIEICDMWISRQPRKRLTLQFFQLQCLSLLAKRVNCVKLKQDWVTSGDLVRLALASGMHRDPSLLSTGRISTFEKEMKKRLWITIAELELQSSIESGLQSSLTSLYWDTPAPTNLPDDTFSTDTEELPASRPLGHFTSASYLVISRQSIPFRIHLMQFLNDPSDTVPYSEVLRYDAQIHQLLSELPKWDDTRAAIPHALLQFQLRQFLLILHKPYAKVVSKNDRFNCSFTTYVNTAGSIVRTYEELLSKGHLALNNMRNDIIRVGLTLSQIVYYNCTLYTHKSSAPPLPTGETHFAENPSTKGHAPGAEVSLAVLPQEPFIAKTLCISAIELLDTVGQIYEQKVMRLGTGYMEFWLLSAAMGMLPSSSSSKPPTTSIAHIMSDDDDVQARCRRTLDRFQSLTFRVLALQKDSESSFASALRSTMASVSPSDLRTPKSTDVGATATGKGYGTLSPPANPASHSAMPGVAMGVGAVPESKDMNDTFDLLQDMQFDLGEYNIPDFWAFDLGGDF